jgi:hypothetical protein
MASAMTMASGAASLRSSSARPQLPARAARSSVTIAEAPKVSIRTVKRVAVAAASPAPGRCTRSLSTKRAATLAGVYTRSH